MLDVYESPYGLAAVSRFVGRGRVHRGGDLGRRLGCGRGLGLGGGVPRRALARGGLRRRGGLGRSCGLGWSCGLRRGGRAAGAAGSAGAAGAAASGGAGAGSAGAAGAGSAGAGSAGAAGAVGAAASGRAGAAASGGAGAAPSPASAAAAPSSRLGAVPAASARRDDRGRAGSSRGPRATPSAITRQSSAHERIASSLPGITRSTSSGSQFVSTSPITGMFSRRASRTASVSSFRSMTNTASGSRRMSATPPRLISSFSSSRELRRRSFVGSRSSWPSAFRRRSSCRYAMRSLDGAEVGQQAAEPAVVDVRLAGARRRSPRRPPAPASWCRRTARCRRVGDDVAGEVVRRLDQLGSSAAGR